VERAFVSVIVASYNARATILRTLASLRTQRGGPPFEIIVVDSSTDGTADLVASAFPDVHVIRSRQRRYAGDARNVGIAASRGDILAFIDADCVVGPEWVDRVAAAHRRDHAVIGGVVENANPSSASGWAYYFTEFNRWLPGARAQTVDEVPGCSMTLKRSAYERYGPFMVGGYCSDTLFQWRLAADGARPHLDPTIRVAHHNPESLASVLRHAPRHGRDFARLRGRERPGRLAPALRALSAPLLPFVLIARAAYFVRRDDTPNFGRFLLASPLTMAAMTAWSWGEMRGYLAVATAVGERPLSASQDPTTR
jgi:glycosyltransferase involved in cell wall biosynthesis